MFVFLPSVLLYIDLKYLSINTNYFCRLVHIFRLFKFQLVNFNNIKLHILSIIAPTPRKSTDLTLFSAMFI